LHAPSVGQWERGYALKAISNRLVGYEFIDKFQRELAKVCGVKHAIAMSSGTAALHIALLCVGVERDTSVIVPSLTFAATANAVDYCGALPHFVDCNFLLTGYQVDRYLALHPSHPSRPSAIVAVDLLGERIDTKELAKVANSRGLPLIEDAAEAMGNFYGMSGASAAILSFNNNKLVTTGGGGVLLTDDDDIAEWALKLSTTARTHHPWLVEHDRVAWNYRMSNICAAIGLAQLERLDEMKQAKQALRERYRQAFMEIDNVEFFGLPWLNCIAVANRDDVISALQEDGIAARALFTPLHRLPHFAHMPRSSDEMPLCEATWRSFLCLPSGPNFAI